MWNSPLAQCETRTPPFPPPCRLESRIVSTTSSTSRRQWRMTTVRQVLILGALGRSRVAEDTGMTEKLHGRWQEPGVQAGKPERARRDSLQRPVLPIRSRSLTGPDQIQRTRGSQHDGHVSDAIPLILNQPKKHWRHREIARCQAGLLLELSQNF